MGVNPYIVLFFLGNEQLGPVFVPLNCRNRSGIALKRFSLIRRWTLKRIPSKNIFSSWRKMSLKKKSRKKIDKFLIFSIEKLIFQVKFLLEKIDFSIEKIKIFVFFSDIFFKIIFLHDDKIFFDGIFLNLISCSRRIVLKQFQHDSITPDGRIKESTFFHRL